MRSAGGLRYAVVASRQPGFACIQPGEKGKQADSAAGTGRKGSSRSGTGDTRRGRGLEPPLRTAAARDGCRNQYSVRRAGMQRNGIQRRRARGTVGCEFALWQAVSRVYGVLAPVPETLLRGATGPAARNAASELLARKRRTAFVETAIRRAGICRGPCHCMAAG